MSDTSMLLAVSALDVLRLQSLESPPRGLVLVVGCVGVLLGLCTALPGWEGCLKVLQAQPTERKPAARRSSGGTPGVKPPSLWQRLHSFDPAAVEPAQRACVLAAQAEDLGGLMNPRHLEGVSSGAVALAKWLQTATRSMGTVETPSAQQAERRDSLLFAAPKMERCEACGKLMSAALLAEHAPACRGRQLDREAQHWEAQRQRAENRQAQAERSRAVESHRREQDVRMPPAEAGTRARPANATPPSAPAPPPAPPPRAAIEAGPEDSLQQFVRAQQPGPLPQAVSAPTWAEQQLHPAPKPQCAASARPLSPRPAGRRGSELFTSTEGGHKYLRAGTGFAATLQARPRPPSPRAGGAASPRASAESGRVLSREEHVQALMQRLGTG